jgi:Flp pilus assembly protein TadG
VTGDDRGAAAVEFALIVLPMMYIICGIIQYGFYFYAMQTGTTALADGLRRVTVGDCQDAGQLKTFITNGLGAARTGGTVFVTRDYYKADGLGDTAPGSVGGKVVISVKFQTLNMHFPLIPTPDSGQVTRTISGRIEDTVPSGSVC